MPRQEPGTNVTASVPSGALSIDMMPEDVRRDLLRQQAQEIDPASVALPMLSMLPAGVALFEFDDAPGETFGSINAIVLGHHRRNVLWDKRFGEQSRDDTENKPACSSADGNTGIPREGFVHAALGAPADGFTTVRCTGCRYNQFGSGADLVSSSRAAGKACNNQRSLYLMIEGRGLPTHLRLPPMSLRPFDEYLLRLVNHGIPLQAVLTKIALSRTANKSGQPYSKVSFTQDRLLTTEEFSVTMAKMAEFKRAMNPTARDVSAEETQVATAATPVAVQNDGYDDVPF